MREIEFQAADWAEVALGDICTFRGGSGFKEEYQGSDFGEYPFIKVSDMTLPGNGKYVTTSNNWVSSAILKKLRANLQPEGATVFAKVGAALKLNRRRLLSRPTAIDNNMMAAIPDESRLDSEFLYYFMLVQDLGRFSQESAVPSVNQGHLSSIEIGLPPLPEQRKIAAILRTWDLGLEKLEALRAANLRRRIWMRSHLFTGRARLPGFSGEWREVALGEVLTEHGLQGTGAEEVFSVSVHKGLVNQIEHLGRSFAAAETGHYNRVLPGDIVYTKSPTGDFPLGIIKQSKISQEVIVSPLYGVFTPATRELGVILDALFESPLAVRNYLHPLVQKGAKNTIAITNRRFLEGRLRLPMDPAEQAVIAAVVEVSQAELNAIVSEIDLLIRQKRGLMQKLLTGEWRVQVEEAA
ncbi:restriction endonuclease subunit S [Altererythrobacter sp. H2]|uniref:restriction endonuclease subunit S n=1 Tax=Altererythrobacter sp. H2 TaxID=3108391 RepID=UPI002B4BB8C0|nr:restriction endonuclease subunit S [Altererythrobacter sp. H2]WRK95270.1 restriction endonuclease subunit S [Altererythrobacter sp. H2]